MEKVRMEEKSSFVEFLGEKMFNKRVLQAILTIWGFQFVLFFLPTSFLKTGFTSLSLYQLFIAPWMNSFLLMLTIGSFGIISSIFSMAFTHAYNVKWSVTYPKRNIDIVSDVFSIKRILSMIILALCGGFLSLSYLYIYYSEISEGLNIKGRIHDQYIAPKPKEFALNEKYFFIAFAAAFLNVMNYFKFYFHQKYLINFPVIDVTRIEKIRLGLFESFKMSFNIVGSLLPIFYMLYFLIGSLVFAQFSSMANIGSEVEFSIWDLKFHCAVAAFTTLAMTTNFFLWKLIQIYTTEEIIVPIESSIPGTVILSSCLSSNNKFLKYLGYKKLKDMSLYSSKELSAVFKLSFPGNHPINWHALYGKSLTFIQEQTNKVKMFNENLIKESEKTIANQLKPPTVYPTFIIQNRTCLDEKTSIRNRGPAFRDLRTANQFVVPKKLKAKQPDIFEILHLKFNLRKAFESSTVYKYFTTPIKSSEISNLFEDASLVIIAIQGLVDISCKSVDEQINETFSNSWNIQREIKNVIQTILDLYLEMQRFRLQTKQEDILFTKISSSNNCHIQEQVFVATLASCERFFYQFYKYFDILCIDFAIQKKLKEIAKPETAEINFAANFLY